MTSKICNKYVMRLLIITMIVMSISGVAYSQEYYIYSNGSARIAVDGAADWQTGRDGSGGAIVTTAGDIGWSTNTVLYRDPTRFAITDSLAGANIDSVKFGWFLESNAFDPGEELYVVLGGYFGESIGVEDFTNFVGHQTGTAHTSVLGLVDGVSGSEMPATGNYFYATASAATADSILSHVGGNLDVMFMSLSDYINQDPAIWGSGVIRTRTGYEASPPVMIVYTSEAPTPVEVEEHYVSESATGDGSGVDWTNAYTTLPSPLERGHIYWIADGTYSAYTFDDAESDTTSIQIRKATSSNHGTDIGWVDTLGDGQATFGTLTFETGNYIIDGTIRNESDWKSSTSYGFVLNGGLAGGNAVYAGNLFSPANVDIGYCYIPGPNESLIGSRLIYNVYFTTGFKLHHSYLFGAGQNHVRSGASCVGMILEYNYFDTNYSSAEAHGEAIQTLGNDGGIVRYNYFENTTGTGTIVLNTVNNWQIYGNVFINSHGTGNGLIAVTSGETSDGTKIYNNTIIGGDQRFDTSGLGTNWEIYNNLFWAADEYVPNFSIHTHDYNAADVDLGETNDVLLSSIPFADSTNGDYSLKSTSEAIDAGVSLTSLYNTDINGNTRGEDGTWDIGAFEYQENVSYYITIEGAGLQDGSSWSNALPGIPNSFDRGATYYVAGFGADSTYGDITLDDALSGTDRITIKKATSTDHGTDTGWTAAWGDSVARFGRVTVSTGYWTWDGQERTDWETGHGFLVKPSGHQNGYGAMEISGADSMIIRYTRVQQFGQTSQEVEDNGILGSRSGGVDNVLVQYCYVHDILGNAFQLHGSGNTVEYTKVADVQGYLDVHSQGFQLFSASVVDMTIRYCRFEDIDGTAVISCAWGTNGLYVYGNVFYNTSGFTGSTSPATIVDISEAGETGIQNAKIYNNTFYHYDHTTNGGHAGVSFYLTPDASSNEIYNNLFIDCEEVALEGTNATHDYNHIVNSSWQWDVTPNTNDLSYTSSDPITDADNYDFTLLSTALAVDAGTSLDATYATDPNGNTRGEDGTWDIGAYEYTDNSPLDYWDVSTSGNSTVIQTTEAHTGNYAISLNIDELGSQAQISQSLSLDDTTYVVTLYHKETGTSQLSITLKNMNASSADYLQTWDGLAWSAGDNWTLIDHSDTYSLYTYYVTIPETGDYTLYLSADSANDSLFVDDVKMEIHNYVPNTRYVNANATGDGSGIDWTNAYTTLPTNLDRGYTYYLADGTYDWSTREFNDAESDSTRIVIKKATEADHGTDTGWVTSISDEQTVVLGGFEFLTGYYTLDGGYNTTTALADTNTTGLKVISPTEGATVLMSFPGNGNRYRVLKGMNILNTAFVLKGRNFDITQRCLVAYTEPTAQYESGDHVITDCVLYGYCESTVFVNQHNVIMERNKFLGSWSSAANHGETIDFANTNSNVHFRNNWVQNPSVYVLMTHGDNEDIYMYNNVISGESVDGMQNLVHSDSNIDNCMRWRVFNNTVFDIIFGGRGAVHTGEVTDPADSSFVYNNLFYNCTRPFMDADTNQSDYDYNVFYDCLEITEADIGPNSQLLAGDPFNNALSLDYTLHETNGINSIDSGTDLVSASVVYDYNYEVRPKGSGYDIGAFEYDGTLPLPESPTLFAFTDSTSTSITVDWNDNSISEDGFRLKLASNDSIVTTFDANTISGTWSGLPSLTSYDVYLVSYNATGESTPSGTITVSTTGTIPNAPSSLASSNITGTSVDLTWNDNSDNELTFYFISGTDTLDTATANQTSHTVSGLSQGTEYNIVVRASNYYGLSDASNIVTITTLSLPNAPSNLAQTDSTTTSITISWTDNSNNESGFRLIDTLTSAVIDSFGANVTSATLSDLRIGYSTNCVIVAWNAIGDSSNSNELLIKTEDQIVTVISIVPSDSVLYVGNEHDFEALVYDQYGEVIQ